MKTSFSFPGNNCIIFDFFFPETVVRVINYAIANIFVCSECYRSRSCLLDYVRFYVSGEKCSVEYTLGYEYDRFHNVTDLMGTAGNGNRTVLLKFYAQATSNAHVMLANEPASYGYEIVLGGGSNRFSEIRRSSRYTPPGTDSDLTNRNGGEGGDNEYSALNNQIPV